MTQNPLSTHVQKSQEALKAFLKKLLGAEVPLEAASPERVSEERSAALRDDTTEHFCLVVPQHDVLVALSPGWVPTLSEAMLGEPLEPDADGAPDLMQEVASQAFGTVQSTLAAEGTNLPGLQFETAGPGQAPPSPDETAWHISFSADHEGTSLDGFVLVPAEEDSSDTDDETSAPASSFAERKSSESSSPQSGMGASASSADSDADVDVSPAAFSDLGDEDLEGSEETNTFGLLAEVDLEVRVELGRRELPLADVLKLTTGSVVELEKMVGEPLSVYANGRLIAEGEAVVIDEQFGVRITDLASENSRGKAFF